MKRNNWTKKSYVPKSDSGHWTISNGHIHFDVHILWDAGGRKDQFPDGVIVSVADANSYAEQIVDALNKCEVAIT